MRGKNKHCPNDHLCILLYSSNTIPIKISMTLIKDIGNHWPNLYGGTKQPKQPNHMRNKKLKELCTWLKTLWYKDIEIKICTVKGQAFKQMS